LPVSPKNVCPAFKRGSRGGKYRKFPLIAPALPFAESNRFSLSCLVFFVLTKKLIHKTQSKKEKQ